jgi:hypothetical protein
MNSGMASIGGMSGASVTARRGGDKRDNRARITGLE